MLKCSLPNSWTSHKQGTFQLWPMSIVQVPNSCTSPSTVACSTTCRTNEMIHHHGWAWASSKLLIYYFVMVHSRICHCRMFISHWAKSSHQCQPFLQPGQLTWLHMHGLSFMPESWAKFLAFMSTIYAWPATWNDPGSQPPSIFLYRLWVAYCCR